MEENNKLILKTMKIENPDLYPRDLKGVLYDVVSDVVETGDSLLSIKILTNKKTMVDVSYIHGFEFLGDLEYLQSGVVGFLYGTDVQLDNTLENGVIVVEAELN